MDADATDPRRPHDEHARAHPRNHLALTMWQQRHDRRLAAKEAAIVYLRAELERASGALRNANDQLRRVKAPAATRFKSSRDDPTMQFLRDRQSSGLREELLRSGLKIRRLQDQLARERRSSNERVERAWRFEVQQSSRFFAFHRRQLDIEMSRREADWAARRFELDQVRALYQPTGTAAVPAEPSSPSQPPLTLNDARPKQTICSVPITSVRVVGEYCFPTANDVQPLITSFIISTSIPLDLVVGRSLLHIALWLLRNGVQPTPRTARIAVSTGRLALVQVVLRHVTSTFQDSDVLIDLPIGDHTEIAEWLVREYPSAMAREFARIASSLTQPSPDKCTRHVDQLKRQWEWDNAVDELCWQRKRARLRAEL